MRNPRQIEFENPGDVDIFLIFFSIDSSNCINAKMFEEFSPIFFGKSQTKVKRNIDDASCQKIVLIFLAVCAFGLFILAPLAHFTVGQRTFSQEILDMDEYFFANGNKWSDGLEAPDGFDLDEELMEGEEYDGEDE